MKQLAAAIMLLAAGCQHGKPWTEADNWRETVLSPQFAEGAEIAVVRGAVGDQTVVGRPPCADSANTICIDVVFDVQLTGLQVIAGDLPMRLRRRSDLTNIQA